MKILELNIKDKALLSRFNNRDYNAFGDVYSLFFKELYVFASRTYYGTGIDPKDAVHDVFISLWKNENIKFEYLSNIKSYIYTSIKNHFKNYLVHKKYINKYNDYILSDDKFVVDIIESEVYSFVSQAINILPRDSADILKYYLDGWNADEIAEKMQVSVRYVYKKKSEAISLLRNRLNKNGL